MCWVGGDGAVTGQRREGVHVLWTIVCEETFSSCASGAKTLWWQPQSCHMNPFSRPPTPPTSFRGLEPPPPPPPRAPSFLPPPSGLSLPSSVPLPLHARERGRSGAFWWGGVLKAPGEKLCQWCHPPKKRFHTPTYAPQNDSCNVAIIVRYDCCFFFSSEHNPKAAKVTSEHGYVTV